jgi:hypothetical protein
VTDNKYLGNVYTFIMDTLAKWEVFRNWIIDINMFRFDVLGYLIHRFNT